MRLFHEQEKRIDVGPFEDIAVDIGESLFCAAVALVPVEHLDAESGHGAGTELHRLEIARRKEDLIDHSAIPVFKRTADIFFDGVAEESVQTAGQLLIRGVTAIDDGTVVPGREKFIAVIVLIELGIAAPGVFASVAESVEEQLDGVVVVPGGDSTRTGMIHHKGVIPDHETEEESFRVPGGLPGPAEIRVTLPGEVIGLCVQLRNTPRKTERRYARKRRK